MVDYILRNYPVSNEEYAELETSFDKLCMFAAHQLLNGNLKNNHTDELDDVIQSLRWAVVNAACYYKRQQYLEDCFKVYKEHITNKKALKTLSMLEDLWRNRTKKRQRFTEQNEMELDQLLNEYVKKEFRPNKNAPLVIDNRFKIYAKSCMWNFVRSIGKGITKMKSLRSKMVSLSQYDHVSGMMVGGHDKEDSYD